MRNLVRLCAAVIPAAALCLAFSSTAVFSSAPPLPAGIIVNSTSDAAANDGLCTLREAITSANSNASSGAAAGECAAGSGTDTITFSVTGTISLTSALPDITSPMTISGPGAKQLTVERSNAAATNFRIFTLPPGVVVEMSGLTITGGRAFHGGGIQNLGTLNIDGCAITGNNSTGGGGGISNEFMGELTIRNSTVSGNSAPDFGGGINNSRSLTVINSTISGNRTDLHGGGIKTGSTNSTLTIINSTITGNQADAEDNNVGAGGGISTFESVVTLHNTIVAGNIRRQATPIRSDVDGDFSASGSYNLIGDGTGMSGMTDGLNGNQIGSFVAAINPRLGPLADNGGSTLTHALLPDSPALDKGKNFATNTGGNPVLTDQRGSTRPVNLDDSSYPEVAGGDASDIGAFELLPLIVNSTADTNDGICTASGTGNGCTLREAITAANAQAPTLGAISFDAALTTGGPVTINLTGALPNIASAMTINGPGSSLLTVRRNTGGDYRIFTVNTGVSATITGLTVSNGKTPDGVPDFNPIFDGGGISNMGTLTMSGVTVNGNRAAAGAGGGIYNGGTLTLTDCVVSNNSTGAGGDAGVGGGIANVGPMTLTDVVVSGNTTGAAMSSGGNGGNGGGISNQGTAATLTRVRVINNTTGGCGSFGSFSGHGGGLYLRFNNVTLKDSTISGNSTGACASGSPGYGGGIETFANVTVTGSTISGNSGLAGGAVLNRLNFTLINSTVSGNNVQGSGAAINNDNGATLTLTNSTIAANLSVGVINNSTNTINTVRNTIIAGNGGGSNPDTLGGFNSQGHNLVGAPSSNMNFHGFNAPGDQIGTQESPLNARLGSLADNGGPTFTHALLPGSPALDAGDNTLALDASNNALTTDQRGTGFARRADSADADTTQTVDIGAFEAQPSVEDIANQTTNEDTQFSINFNVGDATLGIASVTASSGNTVLFPNDSSHVSVTGSGSTRTLTLTPAANLSGLATINVTVTDTNGRSVADTFQLTVTAINDAPTLGTLDNLTIDEDAGTHIVNLSGISAGPNESQGLTVTAVSSDTTLIPHPTVNYTSPNAIGSISFAPAANRSGSATINVTVTDDGGPANGGVNTFSRTFSVTVNAVNDAPVNTVPGAQATFQHTPLVFSAANSNAISVADIDAGTDAIKVTLTASNGTVTLGSNIGLTFVTGDGTDDASVSFNGTINAVNTALNGLSFKPAQGFSGAASLQIVTDDQGRNGSGGALTDTDSITINVASGGTLQFSANPFEVNENGTTATVTVTRTGGGAGAASVNYATGGGTATGGATCGAGIDYVTANGTLNWANGETASKIFTVNICDDNSVEGDETIGLLLSAVTGSATVGANSSATLTIKDVEPAGGLFEFSQATYNVAEGGTLTVTVRRTGNTAAASIDYTTDDGSTPSVAVPCSSTTGLALDRCDFTKALGTLSFAAGETEKTFKLLVSDDSYVEGPETLTLRLSNPTGGAALGALTAATVTIADDSPESSGNPIDDDTKFVTQHYRDFLNRDPDPSGLAFWVGGITACGADAGCREVKRIDTSAAFFLSIEFQETGFLVYRTFKSAFGDTNSSGMPGTVPVRLNEFLTDTQRIGQGVIVNQGNWQQQLEANKQAYALEFVQRQQFLTDYPATMTAAQFVDALNQNTGGVLSADERAQLIASLGTTPNDAAKRAAVLRQVAENSLLQQREFNKAFVLMQYFGYLRRNPDETPDVNFDGYNFWLSKLNEFGGDYRRAEMVKAFLSANEYRQRFGQQ